MLWIWVAAGGALGACARFAVSHTLSSAPVAAGAFPAATFTVNALGALLIGLVVGALGSSGWFNDYGRSFLVTGVLGGFTTFSAFSLELVQLLQGGHIGMAALYALGSLLLCTMAAALGIAISSWLV